MREAQIWYSRSPEQRPIASEFENVVVLSDDFYQEILAHPVPNDLEAVKVLAASPAILDLYMWLSYRSFKARGMESIPIFGEFGLANQLGCVEYSRPRRFRAMLEQWLDTIRAIWPQCPVRIISNGQNIEIRNATPIREQVLSPAGCALNCRHAREIGNLELPPCCRFSVRLHIRCGTPAMPAKAPNSSDTGGDRGSHRKPRSYSMLA
jgi:hypothetical protein